MRLFGALFCLVVLCSCGKPAIDFEPLITAEDERRPDDPALHAAAYSDVPELRARAATAYGRIAKNACIEPLLDLLYDADARVQVEAAFALGQLAWHDDELAGRGPGIVSRLQKNLMSPDAAVRLRAVEAVGKLAGNDAAMVLAGSLSDAVPTVRAEAALALFRSSYVLRSRDPAAPLTPLPEPVMKTLRELVTDGDEGVRSAVVYYFSRFKDSRFSDLLPKLTRDPSLWVRFFAVQAIKRAAVTEGEALAALVSAADDFEYIVRVAVVQALIGLDRAQMLPSKLAMDPSHHVRAALADALGGASPLGESQLVKMWESDGRASVRAAALRNLIGLRKAGAEDLIKSALTNRSYLIRAAAIDSSAVLGSAAEPLLMTTLDDPDEHVRVSTLAALAAVNSPWAFAGVKAALDAPGLAERGTAVDTLSQRQEAERFGAAVDCYKNSSGRRWNDIREMLVDIFAADMSAEGERSLRLALQDPAPAIVAKAKAALMERGASGLPELPVAARSDSPFRNQRFAQNPIVHMKTTRGELEIECFPQEAPLHVASFVGLVEQGYYDALLWHRVVPNFVIQGGDKEGSGWGDAGYSLRAEINGQRYDRGALGMPRGLDFDSGGSQVFFTHVVAPHLDGQYTVFGRIRQGLDVMDSIEEGDEIVQAWVVK